MTIRKRSGGVYHYAFDVKGRTYAGSTGVRDKRDALAFEDKAKQRVKENTTLDKLHETIRNDLTKGARIAIAGAWKAFLNQPKKKKPTNARMLNTQSKWQDFVYFMADKFKEVKYLHQVEPSHAKQYAAYTERHGRWKKNVKATGKNLSPSTLNEMRQICRMVFDALKEDAGIAVNPFTGLGRIEREVIPFEAFSQDELKTIGDKAEEYPDIFHLFMVGMCTGLREGDICMLKWGDVDLKNRCITLIPSKTRRKGTKVMVPMMVNGFHDYMAGLPKTESEYVNKSLARRYGSETTRGGIGKQVGRFLRDECDIQTDRHIKERSRAVKVKGVHSLRHTFCYLAALSGMPLNIVQGIVGHLSEDMTKHYADHADMEAKQEMLANMPNYLIEAPPETDPVADIIVLVNKLSPADLERFKEAMA